MKSRFVDIVENAALAESHKIINEALSGIKKLAEMCMEEEIDLKSEFSEELVLTLAKLHQLVSAIEVKK